MINYLVSIKNLALHFRGFNNFEVVSNALFADNTLNQKNSQVFIIKLFKGLI